MNMPARKDTSAPTVGTLSLRDLFNVLVSVDSGLGFGNRYVSEQSDREGKQPQSSTLETCRGSFASVTFRGRLVQNCALSYLNLMEELE